MLVSAAVMVEVVDDLGRLLAVVALAASLPKNDFAWDAEVLSLPTRLDLLLEVRVVPQATVAFA